MTKKSPEKDQFSDKPANVSKTTRDKIVGDSKLKSCFVITPIGDDNSSIRIKADGLVDTVIIPALGPEFEVSPAHRLTSSGSISVDIINRILDADLVIANLTGLNPNVMYELALRHAAAKPVIIMAELDTKLPFDISDQKTIFYIDHIADVNPTKSKLKKMADQALLQEDVKNPVTIARKNSILMNSPNVSDADKSILQSLQEIKNLLTENKRSGIFKSGFEDISVNEHLLSKFIPKKLVILDKKEVDMSEIYRDFTENVGYVKPAKMGFKNILFPFGLETAEEVILGKILDDDSLSYIITEG